MKQLLKSVLLFTPFIYSWKWLQRSLTNCRAKKAPSLLSAAPICSAGKEEDGPKTPPSSRSPPCTWCGRSPPFLCGGTANPPGCPEETVPCSSAVTASHISPGSQGRREQVVKMLVATPVGHKNITRMRNSFSKCPLVPLLSCLPRVSLHSVSVEALQKPFSNTVNCILLHYYFFFCLASNFQLARDYSIITRQNPLFS